MTEFDCMFSVNILEGLLHKGKLSQEQYDKTLKILKKMIADKGFVV